MSEWRYKLLEELGGEVLQSVIGEVEGQKREAADSHYPASDVNSWPYSCSC